MHHNAMIVMIGNRHIPINNRVSATLLSWGDCCIAVERGKLVSRPCSTSDASGESVTGGGAANGDSFPGSEASLLGRVVIVEKFGFGDAQATRCFRLLYFVLPEIELLLGCSDNSTQMNAS